MFRAMRRANQGLETEVIEEILTRNTSGVLACSGDDGYPYAVPLSYVWDGKAFYFHCAKAGHKIDAITGEAKVSFCIIDQDQIVSQEYTTYFRSVIAFGKASLVTGRDEMVKSMTALVGKYAPEEMKQGKKEIEQSMEHVAIIRLDVEHLTGKEATELAKQRRNP